MVFRFEFGRDGMNFSKRSTSSPRAKLSVTKSNVKHFLKYVILCITLKFIEERLLQEYSDWRRTGKRKSIQKI